MDGVGSLLQKYSPRLIIRRLDTPATGTTKPETPNPASSIPRSTPTLSTPYKKYP